MKHISKIVTVLTMLLLCCFTSVAQTYSDEDSFEEETTKIETITPNIFTALNINNKPNNRNNLIEGNSVFLRQVGDFNQVSAQVAANASDINVVQTGDNNFTDLQYDVDTASANLLQNGNGNRIVDFVYDKSANVSLDLEQNGDNITFERFGTNSMTESMKFKQTEGSPTIIVRSFK